MPRIVFFFISVIFVSIPLRADWVNSLGNMQTSHAVKQSYMQGLLLEQTYGPYGIDALVYKDKVKHFYKQREYRTFWFNNFNEPDLSVVDMMEAIKKASAEGLDTSRYHLSRIETLFQDIQDSQFQNAKEHQLAVISLDIILTDAFFALSHDLYEGLINYEKFQARIKALGKTRKIDYSWEISIPPLNTTALLNKIKRNGEIQKTLDNLVSNNPIFNHLLDAYNRYKAIVMDGGFTKVPIVNLKPGSRDKSVAALAKRLFESDDLDSYDDEYRVFDKNLQNALKKFQRRMGLWATGTLNKKTRIALNVSASKRLAKIKLNLERARWERDPMSDTYVFVNIPAFMVYFMQGDQKLLAMRVVVGRKKNPTPVFQANMSYVVLNPTWTVPESIVRKEMLHKLQDDPDYLSQRKFKAYEGWGKNRKEIDPFDIDWYQYDDESTLPFNFVRDSGKNNPLGVVKFIFPNKHAVYMHDTPDKKYFKRNVRAFSHGCIRLQKPKKMLEFVTDNFMNKSYDHVKSLLKKGELCSLNLDQKVPVYIRYYTAWVNEDGVNFRDDIYGYDKIQMQLLK